MVIFLGSIGYVGVGTLLATMSVQTRTRDILLSILLFPVVHPGLIGSHHCEQWISERRPGARHPVFQLDLLVAYDIIFIAYRVYGV